MNNTVLHVFAACSSEDASGWRRTRLDNLKRTMRIWALPFACVGSRDHWRGFGEMAAQYAAAAEGVPAHHHVVMLDSADAFAQGSTDEVLAAFRRVSGGRPIVLGLETGCPRCRSMVNSSSWPPTAQHAVALAHGSPLDPSVELGPPAMQPWSLSEAPSERRLAASATQAPLHGGADRRRAEARTVGAGRDSMAHAHQRWLCDGRGVGDGASVARSGLERRRSSASSLGAARHRPLRTHELEDGFLRPCAAAHRARCQLGQRQPVDVALRDRAARPAARARWPRLA